MGYKPLVIRNGILPLCNVGQYLGWIAVIVGLIFGNSNIAWLGVILMSGILLFQIITLPVEFDASSRALGILKANYLTTDEYSGARSMLLVESYQIIIILVIEQLIYHEAFMMVLQ